MGLLAVGLSLVGMGAGARATAGVGLSLVAMFRQPVFVAAPPGESRRVFVVEQGGRVRVVRDGVAVHTPFLDRPTMSRSE